MNTCGCKSCGGAAARADALLAQRVTGYAPFVRHNHGGTQDELRNRRIPADLFTRLVLIGATR